MNNTHIRPATHGERALTTLTTVSLQLTRMGSIALMAALLWLVLASAFVVFDFIGILALCLAGGTAFALGIAVLMRGSYALFWGAALPTVGLVALQFSEFHTVYGLLNYIDAFLWVLLTTLVALALARGLRQGALWLTLSIVLLASVLLERIHFNVLDDVISTSANIEAEEKSKQATKLAAAKAMTERAKQTARVIFAEDGATDKLDTAGLTAAEAEALKNKMEAAKAAAAGEERYAYRKQNKADRETTTPVQGEDGKSTLQAAISGSGLTSAINDASTAAPLVRVLNEAERNEALRALNRGALLVHASLIFVIFTLLLLYLRQLNHILPPLYALPIAGRWLDTFVPKPLAVHCAGLDDAHLADFLRQSIRRGESFICFADRDVLGTTSLARLPFGAVKIPHHTNTQPSFVADSRQLVEGAWMHRSACTITDASLVFSVLDDLLIMLEERRVPRAAAQRTLNVVWACATAPSEEQLDELLFLSFQQNIRVLLLHQGELPPAATARIHLAIEPARVITAVI